MLPPPAENTKKGKLTAKDLENTVGQKPMAQVAATQPALTGQHRTLAQVPPFNPPQSTSDTWSPKPYAGQQERTIVQQDKEESAGLAKPSLVFVANTTERTSPLESGAPLVPSLGLGTGARLSARLASVVTTAVDVPVVAINEYTYELNGDIAVPAGTKAVGRVRQGDRSGYVSINFDHLEMPDKSVV
jgi:hypothetical protein